MMLGTTNIKKLAFPYIWRHIMPNDIFIPFAPPTLFTFVRGKKYMLFPPSLCFLFLPPLDCLPRLFLLF